jgi:hypothetical protein
MIRGGLRGVKEWGGERISSDTRHSIWVVPRDDQGSVLLEEKERSPTRPIACWFSKDQADQFSKIKGGQYITVKGIFNGEAGADLKFCKLVKIE